VECRAFGTEGKGTKGSTKHEEKKEVSLGKAGKKKGPYFRKGRKRNLFEGKKPLNHQTTPGGGGGGGGKERDFCSKKGQTCRSDNSREEKEVVGALMKKSSGIVFFARGGGGGGKGVWRGRKKGRRPHLH